MNFSIEDDEANENIDNNDESAIGDTEMKEPIETKKAFFVLVCDSRNCGKLFTNQEKFDQHKQEKHNLNKFKCQHCSFESEAPQHINAHKEKCKPENVEKCVVELCNYKTSSQYRLYNHERAEHGINTRGKMIKKKFLKRRKMTNGIIIFLMS